MNYLKNINHQYGTITDFSLPIIFYKDNDYYQFQNTTMSNDISQYSVLEYIGSWCDLANNRTNHGKGDIAFVYMPNNNANNYRGYFLFNQFTDYLVINSVGNSHLTTTSVLFDYETTNESAISSAFDTSENYLQVSTNGFINGQLGYDTYQTTFTNTNQTIVFDNTFVQEYIDPNSGNLFEFQLYRENLFRTTGLELYSDDLSSVSLNISMSDMASYEFQQQYNDAYGVGFIEGESVGYTNGWTDGYNANGIDDRTIDAFDYIGQSFHTIEVVLGIEVLPNITLGLVASIPFVIGMIGLIFKLVKK